MRENHDCQFLEIKNGVSSLSQFAEKSAAEQSVLEASARRFAYSYVPSSHPPALPLALN
jgi:hypothetical protein